MKVGIDASNLALGGGVTHLLELMQNIDQCPESIERIYVFASTQVLEQLPELSKVEKVSFPQLNKKLYNRVLFQLKGYDDALRKYKLDLIYSITGDYLGKLRPVVGMSQNMLLYDRFIWKDFRQFRELMRAYINYRKQRYSFKNSAGIIFISNYAKENITRILPLEGKKLTLIHHGISSRFIADVKTQKPIGEYSTEHPFRLLYVSTVHVYKHQWNVVEAVAALRKKGYPLELHLAGTVIFKPSGRRLTRCIEQYDPLREFVVEHGWVNYEDIDKLYKSADAFVFASDCENMPNILIEAMSAGLPLVCSDRNPMPEFAGEYAYYFKSRNVDSIVNAIEQMLLNPERREWKAVRSRVESEKYGWTHTSRQTFQFLVDTYADSKQEK
jgi:glycosyltransferase involved in cell wall biosynthesis